MEKSKMDLRIKRLWCDALRSKKYEQIVGRLRAWLDDNKTVCGYCALGVLCEIYRTTEPSKAQWTDDGYIGMTMSLPYEVMKWAGLDGIRVSTPVLGELGLIPVTHAIASLNDECDRTFEEIAAFIDSQL